MTIERGDIIGVILGKSREIRVARYGRSVRILDSGWTERGPNRTDSNLNIILALVLITGIVWALVLYLRYFFRRKKLLKKMNEIRRGPSHTLAMMGLSIIMPFAPGKILLDVLFSKLADLDFFLLSIINGWFCHTRLYLILPHKK